MTKTVTKTVTKIVKLIPPPAVESRWFTAWIDPNGHRKMDWCQTREQAEEFAVGVAAEGMRHVFVGYLEAAAVCL